MKKSSDSDEYIDAFVWTIRNGYKVFPKPLNNDEFQIMVTRGCNEALIDKIYTKKTIDDGIAGMILKIYKQKAK